MHYGKMVAGVLLGLSLAGWGAGAEARTVDSFQAEAAVQGGQTAQRARHVYQNQGLRLRIPQIYGDLVLTEVLQDAEGDLFSVSERASLEAVRKAHPGEFRGAGWLFSIGRVSEERLHELLRGDMSGADLFAADGKGNYYIFYHPTDVRYVRETPEAMRRDQEQWTRLNTWAREKVRERFIKDNPSLTAMTADNSSVGMSLAEILYGPGTHYTMALNGAQPLPGDKSRAVTYGQQLLFGNTFEMINEARPAKGDRVTLSLPGEQVRLDFYQDKLGGSYVWEKRPGLTGNLYLARPVEEHAAAFAVAKDWYQALKDGGAQTWKGRADALVGAWAEKIAGRGVINITKSPAQGVYKVEISWGNSAYETYLWSMTARADADGSLRYEDCCHSIMTFSEDGQQGKEEMVYDRGRGSFTLNSANEIMWQDEVEGAGANAVFVSTK